MKRLVILSVWAVLAMFISAGDPGRASDQPAANRKMPAIHCPVVGIPEAKACCCPSGYCPRGVSPKITLDYRGGKVQFCCPACVGIFKKTPTKFSAVAHHQLAATGQAAQTKCPLCGKNHVSDFALRVADVNVAFASAECLRTVADAKAAQRVELVFGDKAFARGFAVPERR